MTLKEHIKALEQSEKPRNVSEVRHILGLANYSARYIHNFATNAEPLRNLIRAKYAFEWGAE